MARIAIIGAGAIGSSIAAALIEGGGHQVELCVRTPVDRLRVETPQGVLEVYPRVHTSPKDAAPSDWVFVVTKTYDTPSIFPWLERIVGADTRVAVLQNGVEHRERLAKMLPADHILPVIVDIPAERTAPGEVLQRRTGSMLVPSGRQGEAFVELLSKTTFEVSTTEDFVSAAWRKLAINCAGAVNALALKPAGIAHVAPVAEVMRGLVRECLAVGRAEGADLPDALVEGVVAGYREGSPDAVNSIHADRAAGRRMEWDARNGVIVRLARKHGLTAPLNGMAAALLEAAEG